MTICSMTVFRFRNYSPVIPRPLHNSATMRSTTLPIELINDQRDMSVDGYKNAKYPPSRGQKGKRHTTSLKLCNIKLDYTSRLMGVNTCAGNPFCIVPKTLTETSRVKRRQKYRDAQSHMFSRFPPLSTRQQRYQGHESFRGVQKKTHRDQEKSVFSSKLPTTRDVRYTQTRRENNVQQGRRKTRSDVKYSRVATFARCPIKDVEVQSQNRDSLIRDVCTCLACTKTFPRSLTTLEETRR